MYCTHIYVEGFKSADGAEEFLINYNATAEQVYYDAVLAEWNYNTNINEETQAAAVSGVNYKNQSINQLN